MSGVDSSVILVNLTNDTKIANKAIVTGISSSGTQSPSQGNVHHMIMPASNGNWYTSTVSSASSGHYNIDIDDGIPVKQKGISQSIIRNANDEQWFGSSSRQQNENILQT